MRVPGWLRQHWMLKLSALFLAFILWLVVSAREPTEEVLPVVFQPRLDSSLELVSQPPMLRALIIGRGRELLQLSSSPPSYRPLIPAEVPDTLRLFIDPGAIEIPPNVDVIVRDVQPRSLVLRFASTLERMVPVKSGLTLAPDPSINIEGSPDLEPDSVLVTGPRLAVAKVDSVSTVRETRAVCDGEPWVVALDTAGLAARVRPAQVSVRVPVKRDTTVASAPPCAPTGGRNLRQAAPDGAAPRRTPAP